MKRWQFNEKYDRLIMLAECEQLTEAFDHEFQALLDDVLQDVSDHKEKRLKQMAMIEDRQDAFRLSRVHDVRLDDWLEPAGASCVHGLNVETEIIEALTTYKHQQPNGL